MTRTDMLRIRVAAERAGWAHTPMTTASGVFNGKRIVWLRFYSEWDTNLEHAVKIRGGPQERRDVSEDEIYSVAARLLNVRLKAKGRKT